MNPPPDVSKPSRPAVSVRREPCNGREVLVLFTRFPEPGRTKTRLIPALGAEGAARLQQEMAEYTVISVQPAILQRRLGFEVRFDGGSVSAMRRWLGRGAVYAPQGGGDLGQRLHRAVADACRAGAGAVVMIGSDCPGLDGPMVCAAFDRLRDHPVVLGPATDGGYYLIGLRQPLPQLFEGITWGGPAVLTDTLAIARRSGLEPSLLPELSDVDDPQDLAVWEEAHQASRTLSVIIPTLNEVDRLVPTLATIPPGSAEIIVADGGSVDGTIERALSLGTKVVGNARGRARQMNAGAAVARGRNLLFLHADTDLPVGAVDAIHRALRNPETVGGAFAFQIREDFFGRPAVEFATNLRSRLARMPYGDQAIFVRRWVFEHLGGFPDYPLMEDYEFVRRLRRLGQIVTLDQKVRTSGRRWRRLGFLKTALINRLMVLGFHLGVAPERLAAIYYGNDRGDSPPEVD